MAVEIKVPSVGESISEGTISRWLKKDGAVVRAQEPLFELETEKATTEVAAPASGKLVITVAEGKTVPIGAVVGRIEEASAGTAREERASSDRVDGQRSATPAATPETPNAAPAREQAEPAAEVVLSPAARRLVAEEDVPVEQLKGSGRGGLVTKEDVLRYLDERRAPTVPGPQAPEPTQPLAPATAAATSVPGVERETRQRMSAIRQRIGERLVAAQHSAAILTTFNEADLSGILSLRTRYKEAFQKKHGVGLGFMSFFVKACVEALKAFPLVNARIDGGDIVLHHFYDVGVAVSTDKGLMVPVVRDADKLSFAEVEQRIAALAEKARAGKMAVADLQGGTFTITNGGVFGSLLSTPLLNPPQSGILGMHATQKRPVVVDDQVVIRPMMYLALSYDHRLIDGREAVGFLVRVKECVENPERLLLGI